MYIHVLFFIDQEKVEVHVHVYVIIIRNLRHFKWNLAWADKAYIAFLYLRPDLHQACMV